MSQYNLRLLLLLPSFLLSSLAQTSLVRLRSALRQRCVVPSCAMHDILKPLSQSDMLAFADEAAQSQQTKVDSKRQRMAKWKVAGSPSSQRIRELMRLQPEVESKADTGKRKKGESAVMVRPASGSSDA